MATQKLMWTALPNGVDENGGLRVSVLLSPRLTPDADQTLAPFDDFIDWPATVKAAKFTVHFGAQSIALGGEVASQADSDTWKALIQKDTFVRGFVFEDHTSDKILSYDTVSVNSLTQSLYSSLGAASSDALPKVSAILADAGWQGLVQAVQAVDRRSGEQKDHVRNVARQMQDFRNETAAGQTTSGSLSLTLQHAELFHTPPSKPRVQDYSGAPLDAKDPRRDAKWLTFQQAKLPAPEDFSKLIDFHQMIAAMNQYPKLLRLLGIVVDIVIPAGKFSDSPDQPLWVTCEIPNSGVAGSQASPRTRTQLAGKTFGSVPRPQWKAGDYRVRGGLLQINPDTYAILQSDVDAAALKLMNFARTLGKMSGRPELQVDVVTKQDKQSGVPALRNAGLMLVQRRRDAMLANSFAANQSRNSAIESSFGNAANAGPDLFAEDLIRGWRIDIWDRTTAKWHSLCERLAKYTVGGTMNVEDNAEGVVRLAATKAADGTNQDLIYLHEAMVSWTGWSLVAAQPGRVVNKDDQSGDANMEVPPGINLSTEFRALAGSLPRLRYGRGYWIRARMVDLAANSLAPNEKTFGDESPEKNAVLYTRFEPVQAPSLALLTEGGNVFGPAEGESMARVAIRTFNDTPDKNAITIDTSAWRGAAPARSSVREAELHGKLDEAGKVNGSSVVFDLLAKKDAPLQETVLTTAGSQGATVETHYAVMDSVSTGIPYLPDPLCTTISARIFNHPGINDATIINIPAYTNESWPQAVPFRIRIFEDPAQTPHFNVADRVLEIPLPKAVRATLRLSCQLEGESLSLMGVWNWIPAAARVALEDKAKAGQHWMLTPWRNLELVHATQKPLIAPVMTLTMDRGFGQTKAVPRFTATCSINSTARVDLQAEWHEPDSDVEPALGGADRARSDHAFSVKITDPQNYAGAPEHDMPAPDVIGVNQNPRAGANKFHEYNDTRYRRVTYFLEATSRFREFMPASVLLQNNIATDENIKVTGQSLVTWVPNSAPPPAPAVLYVVPTFGWTSSTDAAGNESRWRKGGGLRVYLDRPWNATGYGEMLGVVLQPLGSSGNPGTPDGKPYSKYITQWGNDPVWASAFVPGASPRAANFPLARTAPDGTGKWLPVFAPASEADQKPGAFLVSGLPHPAMSDVAQESQYVDLAPHDVVYDAERHLWYADIEINFGHSYFPFIRLALARYQPTSLFGANLSNIVLADFMALTPDRGVSVTHGSGPDVRNVSVFGYTYSDSSGHKEAAAAPSSVILNTAENPVTVAGSSIVSVWVEKLDPAMGMDFGWKREDNVAVVATPPTVLRDVRRPWPTLWQGTVTLPANRTPDARYRIAITEYEEYITDDLTAYDRTPSTKGNRIVFLEYVEIK